MRSARPAAANVGTRTCGPKTKSAKRNQYPTGLLFFILFRIFSDFFFENCFWDTSKIMWSLFRSRLDQMIFRFTSCRYDSGISSSRIVCYPFSLFRIFPGKSLDIPLVPDPVNETNRTEFFPDPHHIHLVSPIPSICVDNLPAVP